MLKVLLIVAVACLLFPSVAVADADIVVGKSKISTTSGGFGGGLSDGDTSGHRLTSLGDLDGNGVTDLAVGAPAVGTGADLAGSVWILFLDAGGHVLSKQEIADGVGGISGGTIPAETHFGVDMANLGDVDGDGVTDLAVGAQGDDDGGTNRGAIWILLLNSNGTVKSHQKISDLAGGFGGELDDRDSLGKSVAALGDLRLDGPPDVVVGANGDVLDSDDLFGTSVATIPDLDADGVQDLAVGALFDDDRGPREGAVWILFLATDGSLVGQQKINSTNGLFGGLLENRDEFGRSVASPGDLDGDGVPDLLVGAIGDDDGGAGEFADLGATWILFLHSDGTVKGWRKISSTAGGFLGPLTDGDRFGSGVSALGDFDGDGNPDIAVGAYRDDDGGIHRGAVWILRLADLNDPLLLSDWVPSMTFGFQVANTSGGSVDNVRFSAPRAWIPGSAWPDSSIGVLSCSIEPEGPAQFPVSPPSRWCRVDGTAQARWFFPAVGLGLDMPPSSVTFSVPRMSPRGTPTSPT